MKGYPMNRRDLIRTALLALFTPTHTLLEDEDSRARRVIHDTLLAIGWQPGTGRTLPHEVLARAVRHGGREFCTALARFMVAPVRTNPWAARA